MNSVWHLRGIRHKMIEGVGSQWNQFLPAERLLGLLLACNDREMQVSSEGWLPSACWEKHHLVLLVGIVPGRDHVH